MNLADFKNRYIDAFTVMGGLDVQTTIGFGDHERLKREIERVTHMFADGGLIFCTSHFVQSHCTIEELTLAYDTVYECVRRDRAGTCPVSAPYGPKIQAEKRL